MLRTVLGYVAQAGDVIVQLGGRLGDTGGGGGGRGDRPGDHFPALPALPAPWPLLLLTACRLPRDALLHPDQRLVGEGAEGGLERRDLPALALQADLQLAPPPPLALVPPHVQVCTVQLRQVWTIASVICGGGQDGRKSVAVNISNVHYIERQVCSARTCLIIQNSSRVIERYQVS